MISNNLVARDAYYDGGNPYAWLYSTMALWILTWIAATAILICTLVTVTRATEPKHRWTSWFKGAFGVWVLFLTVEACFWIMYTVEINTSYDSAYDSDAYIRRVERLREASEYVSDVTAFIRDCAVVATFLALVHLGLDMAAAPRAVILKSWVFLLAGVLYMLSIAEFALDVIIGRQQIRRERGHVYPYYESDSFLALVKSEKGVTVAQQALFEIAAITNLVWAVVVAVRGNGNGQSSKGSSSKAVTYYLVCSVLYLLHTSYALVVVVKAYYVYEEFRSYDIFLHLVFNGWPVTIIFTLLFVLARGRVL